MKAMILALAAACVLAGCEFSVPLVSEPDQPMPPELVGRWQRAMPDGKDEVLLVLPWSDKEFLIAWPERGKETLYAAAALCEVDGQRLAQLRWFGTGEGKAPDKPEIYQFARWTLENDRLSVQTLDRGILEGSVDTPEALRAAIRQAKDRPGLFREALVYSRDGQKSP